MTDIVTEQSGNILRIQLNRPAKKNAMTSAMYITMADLLESAAKDDGVRVVLWHGEGDSFCAGNNLSDFLKNPPGPQASPQSRRVEFSDAELPKSGSGKILKRVLRERFWAHEERSVG